MNINNNFTSIEQVRDKYLQNNSVQENTASANQNVSFEDILKQTESSGQSAELKFSKHADDRMADRNINLTSEQMQRLEDAAKRASEKGIKESLVIVDKMAFIVNVKNNTVITAMDQLENEGNVFTNIDGAVIN
jgi:flagellar operon protein